MPPPAEGLASRLFVGPALRTQPDRRLVTLVREGYEAAFEEIVRRYGRPLGRYAASIVGGRSEDVLQDAFAKALPALQRDDAEIDLRPWLFRIVRNTALNDLRDSPPSPELLAEALAGGSDPAEELERRERLADLIRQLQALPEPQRAAIVMRELEGLGHDEIAAALGLSGGGARQAIYRARQALRDGAGLLLPLPLLRLLVDHGAEAAGAGAAGGGVAAAAAGTGGGGAAAGGLAAGGAAAAGGAGAGGALKLGVVAAVLAGSVGTGIAVQERHDGRAAEATASPAAQRPGPGGGPAAPAVGLAALPDNGSTPGEDRREGEKRGHREGSGDRKPSDGGRSGHGPGRRGGGSFSDRHRPPRGTHGPRNGRHGTGRHDARDDRGRHGDGTGPRHLGDRSGPGRGDDEGLSGDGRRGGHRGDDSGDRDGGAETLDAPDRSGPRDGSGSESGEDSGSPPPPPPPEEESSGPGGGSEGGSGGEGDESRDLRQ